jgi:hypothetical protein
MPTARFTVERKIIVAVLVVGGLITLLLEAWRGDPQAQAAIEVGLGLIGAQALVLLALQYYMGVKIVGRLGVLLASAISYACVVTLFAILFSWQDGKGGIHRPEDGSPLSTVSALYLSVATMTGLGYTDRYPATDGAKIIAVVEVLAGLGFTVFIFSLLAGALRVDRDNASSRSGVGSGCVTRSPQQ